MANVNDIIFWYGKNIIQDSSNRLVTDIQIAYWNKKSDTDHTHNDIYYTKTEIDKKLGNISAGIPATLTWGDITDKPDAFIPSSHNHIISDITDLQAKLDTKVSNAPILVTDWNSATDIGYYYSEKAADNSPEETLGYFGQICKSLTSIIQILYPEDASGDIKQYMRRGTISKDDGTITWESDWGCATYAR